MRGMQGQGTAARPGETIYKGHRSYDLMLNLQLGVRYCVGRINPTEPSRGLMPADFEYKVAAVHPITCSR